MMTTDCTTEPGPAPWGKHNPVHEAFMARCKGRFHELTPYGFFLEGVEWARSQSRPTTADTKAQGAPS